MSLKQIEDKFYFLYIFFLKNFGRLLLQSSNLLSLSLVQMRLESIQKSPVSLKSTVAILMSFTCNDICKFINQRYYNQVL